jgi:energy-coupling factor transport system ATP-binding protein
MIATLRDVAYRYPSATDWTLQAVNAEIRKGSFTLLAGPSAGGKSTLLRTLNGLVPQFHGGLFHGDVRVAGIDPARMAARRVATIAGMVFQEPESQAICDVVEDEIAFGMEQHGIPRSEMHRRIASLLAALGIEHLRYRRLATLSGGERQRVAIAAVLALEARLLLLDEPTSQLDPEGAAAVLDALDRLRHSGDLTILVAEHRLERLLPAVDAVLQVEAGRVTPLTPREAAACLRSVPAVCELARRLGLDPIPLTLEEAHYALQCHPPPPTAVLPSPAASEPGASATGWGGVDGQGVRAGTPGEELLSSRSLTVAYDENVALRDVDLTVREGELVALIGPNGSGKTTLFRALSGLVHPSRGEVRVAGKPAPRSVSERTAFAGLVPQDPALALYHETVRQEVGESARNRRAPDPSLAEWGLDHLAAANPRDISVGQQQRVALAAMLSHGPRVWLLDEPTRGADGGARRWLAERLRAHSAAGGAAIVATHDIESAARFATRVIALDHGQVIYDLPARAALGSTGPFPTQTARLIPGALLPDEVSP